MSGNYGKGEGIEGDESDTDDNEPLSVTAKRMNTQTTTSAWYLQGFPATWPAEEGRVVVVYLER